MEAPGPHSETPSALPAGTRLGEFELLSVLGVGGFGIVYLAFDHALEREVAVKEYMPSSLAGRTQTMHVSLRSPTDAETFALGLRSFVNEARLLARFDHSSLLKVHRFWEANGTAYMAMPVMRGRTLKEIRLEMVGPPDEAWLRALLDPLMGAIEKLHSEGVFHRDIAPDNIQIEPDGRPILLDFGAARRVLGDKSQSLTAILKPAYAPIEQYAEAGAVKQGPWTDIYALGATLHFLLLTRPPPPATTRAVHDEASLLIPQFLPGCSPGFLNVIDWMLAPRPSDRPQSVAMLRDVLEGRAPPPVRREPAPTVSQWERTLLVAPPRSQATTAPSVATLAQLSPLQHRDDEPTMRIPAPAAARVSAGSAAKQAPGSAGAAAGDALPTIAAASASARLKPVTDPQPASPQAAVPSPAALLAIPSTRLLAIGLGAAALLVLAFVAVLSLRTPVQPATVITEPAVTMPVATAPPPSTATATAAPTPTPPAPPAAPSVAEPQLSTITVPSSVPATSPPVATAAVNPATTAVPATPSPIGQPAPARVAEWTPPPGDAATTNTTAGRPLPVQQRPQAVNAGGLQVATVPVGAPANTGGPAPRNNADVPQRTPANTRAAAVSEAQRQLAAGPEARCGGRNPFSRFVCMERECLRSEQLGHADCQKWRQNAKND